jgi:hypothetical protein
MLCKWKIVFRGLSTVISMIMWVTGETFCFMLHSDACSLLIYFIICYTFITIQELYNLPNFDHLVDS